MNRRDIVKIQTEFDSGTAYKIGPGVYLTCFHVVKTATQIQVILETGETLSLSILASNELLDVMVLKEDNSNSELNLSTIFMDKGEQLYFSGYPAGNYKSFKGKLNTDNPAQFSIESIETALTNYKGLSGGPVFSQGHLVGIASAQTSFREVKFWKLSSFSDFLIKVGIKLCFEVPFRNITEQAIQDLDERYTSKLPPLKLRNHKIFNGLALDPIFFKRFQICCKDLFRWRNDIGKPFEVYNGEIQKHENQIRTEIRRIFESKSRMQFEDSELLKLLYAFDKYLNEVSKVIQDSGYEESRRKKETGEYTDYPHTYHRQESTIRSIEKGVNKIINFLISTQSCLANDPILILEGEAGQGKSHLLADIANDRMAKGETTLLWLGEHFNINDDPRNLLSQNAKWSGSWEDFLKYLEKIADFQGSRVLLFIDALNEGAGLKIWPSHLPSFISEVRKHPKIGLVLSVRTTYKNSLFPEAFLEKHRLSTFKHEGFKGVEFEALTHFCHAFGLEVPSNGIFNPEFANPQFLLLTCTTLQDKGAKKFPTNPQGYRELYQSYLAGKDEKWKTKYGLTINRKTVSKAVLLISKHMLESNSDIISLDDSCTTVSSLFDKKEDLVDFLVAEDVFALNYFYNHKTHSGEDGVRFTYQKLSDFQKVATLFEEFKAKDSWIDGFKPGGSFYERFGFGDEYNPGIQSFGLIEVLSVLLPERFQLELIELFDFPKQIDRTDAQWHLIDFLKYRFLESLKWRAPGSIDPEKTIAIIQRFFHGGDHNRWLEFLLENASEPNHPYNSDYLHSLLSEYKLAERDSFWGEFMWDKYGNYDSGSPQVVKWLIDWAWNEDRHSILDDEVVRLSSIPIAWFLSSSVRAIRDSATKGLTCLLTNRLLVARSLLEQFHNCNDPYVVERLLGAVYGALTKTKSSTKSEIQELCQYVFEWQFANGKPGPNIMIRHYAKSILDYGLTHGVEIKGDFQLATPPYKSQLPPYPTIEEVDSFKLDYESVDYKKKNGFVQNKIHHSVIEWDFNRKIMDPLIGHFSPYSFTINSLIDDLKLIVGDANTKLFDLLIEVISTRKILEKKLNWAELAKEKKSLKVKIRKVEKSENIFKKLIEKLLDPDRITDFQSKVLPYLEIIDTELHSSFIQLDHTIWSRWILKRVFDLGWTSELLGNFDEVLSNNHRAERLPGKVERVGKKYQWIALYEALGIIADNHYLRYDPKTPEGKKYKGLCQVTQPDIDVTALLADSDLIPKQEVEINEAIRSWWLNFPPPEFVADKVSWVKSSEGLPDFKTAIQVKDDTGLEWFFLRTWFTEDSQEDELFEDRRDLNRCSVMLDFDSFLIPTSLVPLSKTVTKKELRKKIIFPYEREKTGILNREWYWSPTYKYRTSGEYVGYDLEAERKIQAIPTTHYQWFESDLLAQSKFLIPNTYIFENLNLRFRKEEGQFENADGTLVCQDPSLYQEGDRSLLIRKDELLKLLSTKNLALVVLVDGEKRYEESTKKGTNYHRYEFNQVITVLPDGQIIEGPFDFRNRDRPE